jgi:hypothetical protein
VPPAHCSCGFTELGDEQVIDHLLRIFEPDDRRGKDGLVHEETRRLVCSCGFDSATTHELDAHFLVVFTPADGIGRDGASHSPAGGQP